MKMKWGRAVLGRNLLFALLLAVVLVIARCHIIDLIGGKGNAEAGGSTEQPSGNSEDNGFTKQPERAYFKPVEVYGKIRVAAVNGKKTLCDEAGNPVQLRGVNVSGLQWGGDWILTEAGFDALAYDWQCGIIRLGMYVQEGGYANTPSATLAKIERGIQLATARGMYALVDWHVLTPGDPSDSRYSDAGKNDANMPAEFLKIKEDNPSYTGPQIFFAYLSQKYGGQPNVLFETANEPNNENRGADDSWAHLLTYHQSIVDAIRKYDKDGLGDNIVICGTGQWSQKVDEVIGHEVVDAKEQIMYAVHFYAGTHRQSLRDRVTRALNGNIAVFGTEWGTSEADGGRNLKTYFAESDIWLSFFKNNNISWCNWITTKWGNEQSSASFMPAAAQPSKHDGRDYPDWPATQLSESGKYVRNRIRAQ